MVLLDRFRTRWLQILVHAGALLPLAWMAWEYSQGLFIVDPVREMTTRTGKTALILLILALACTPINTIFGSRQVLRVRRALGLYAFVYASIHFAIFVVLDYGLDMDLIWQAVLDQRYVLAGFAAGLILLVLASTSTKGWQRRLGRTWKRLQRLVYLAGVLAIVHFLWLVKDIGEPLRWGIVLAVLLALRLPRVRKAASNLRYQIGAGRKPKVNSDVTG